MILSLDSVIKYCGQNPKLLILVISLFGLIFVNGISDAPNSIATAITTRALKLQYANFAAAIFNFLGVFTITMIHSSVAKTMFHIVDFTTNPRFGLIALLASIITTLIWIILGIYYGVPVSSSHSLILSLTGGSFALYGSYFSYNKLAMMKIIFGLLASTILAVILGRFVIFILQMKFKDSYYSYVKDHFKQGQVISSFAMCFMHGAQSGQKFMGIFMLALSLSLNNSQTQAVFFPSWLMITVAIVLGIGSSLGSKRIIKSIGLEIMPLRTYEGFASDITAIILLLISTILGSPVSTTYTKTSAIIGVGLRKGKKGINWRTISKMGLVWLITFPLCFVLGYVLSLIFYQLF